VKLSVIIPVFNESTTIAEVIMRVEEVPLDKEIIVVDDGSSDGTVEILREFSRERRILLHESRVNLGKGAAVRIGLTYASGPIIIIQDADLELDPNEYGRLMEPILKGRTRVVYGSRFLGTNSGIPLITLAANRFLVLLTNLLYDSSLTDMETAYKVFHADVLKDIRLNCMRFELEPEITAKLIKNGDRILEVPISYQPRTVQGGKKIGWRDGLKAILTLFRYRLTD
jgi:glycosyltransferase involved in cell wall biosynthesis